MNDTNKESCEIKISDGIVSYDDFIMFPNQFDKNEMTIMTISNTSLIYVKQEKLDMFIEAVKKAKHAQFPNS